MKRFRDKRVFVTGSAVGIGYEICRQFLTEGAEIGLNSLENSTTLQAVEALNAEAGAAAVTGYPGDISNVEKLNQSIKEFSATKGIDILIANAGVTLFKPFLEVEPEAFDYLMRVNMMGTYFSVQAAAKEMVRHQKQGRIILMSSVCGHQAHRNLSAYAMTKAGIRQLAKSLSEELGEYGITVNAIAPGATTSERTLEDPEYEEGWKEVTPIQNVTSPSDVAHVALFLADDRSRQITGEFITVDGGWTSTSPLPKHLQQQFRADKKQPVQNSSLHPN